VLEDTEKILEGARAEEALSNVKSDLILSMEVPTPSKQATQRFMFFAGPKSTNLMREEGYAEFYTLIEDSYGSMAWINTSLLWILKLFHSIFGNWGVAIIGLTFVVKLALFPLNRVQQVSMHGYSEKMKKLKPKLDEIKKKYKNNKKKFNQAQMELMREEGVRPPLMGCLLIFLQFPIFIGLFQILRTAYELRHSPFCLWVQDLSQPDALFPLPFTIPLIGSSTFNLLPILMTVAFYYQQKMMPKPDTTDPTAAQMQKIMKFMPIMFGFMFYGYAAGLSLYWMTSNIISIIEYRFIRKKFPIDKAKEERVMKSSVKGSAKFKAKRA
jgi:YidC/Oxa1 family membrane protein insertase